jgi:hypothetical protein
MNYSGIEMESKQQPVRRTVVLPPDVCTELDLWAAEEDRPFANQMRQIVAEALERRRRIKARARRERASAA